MELPEEVKQLFRESGKKGGNTTLKRHGKEHFNRITKLAIEARKRNKQLREKLQEENGVGILGGDRNFPSNNLDTFGG